jgi:hypothetical protein
MCVASHCRTVAFMDRFVCLFLFHDGWLTVHRSITLVDFQLDAQNNYLFIYIINLLKSSTCFEHYPAHLQEVYVVIVYMQPLVSSLSAGGCPVYQLRKQFCFNRWTGQSPAESDDNKGCIYIYIYIYSYDVDLLKMSRVNARNM